jgi:hypothetical protein
MEALFYKSPMTTLQQIAAARVPWTEFDSLLSDCRSAIIQIKYLLIAIMVGRGGTEDRHFYLEGARRCEQRFGLTPIQSSLRQRLMGSPPGKCATTRTPALRLPLYT